jgi:hypothetical protein
MGSKMKIYRDANGVLINIGEWDYAYQEQTVLKPNADAGGYSVETEIVAKNPMPDGVLEDEAEIIEGWDGGLYLANDPKALKS